MAILSIQSHVAYGYVGNKAAVYPLQAMGFDVWPVHTVQFSNHTGYGKWQGEIFSADHVKAVVQGIKDIGQIGACEAVLSGYMGSHKICKAVSEIVQDLKAQNTGILYLCDPVIGNKTCFVTPDVFDFFQDSLKADIITPNQYEAELLSDISITNPATLRASADYFHKQGVKIVVITGIKLAGDTDTLSVFVSTGDEAHIIKTKEYPFTWPVNGTGDLFSALFLGCYLRTKDAVLSLRQTTAMLQSVLQTTFETQSHELQVLAGKYDGEGLKDLPEALAL